MAITETRQLPPKFIEQLGEDLGKQIVAQSGVPVVAPGAAGITQFAGESPEDFAARQEAGRRFDIRQQNLAGLAPTVAGQDRLQQQAQTIAEAGIGSFQPFLQQAQAAGTAAGTALGGIGTGAQAFQQDVGQFMSPYQSQVIDATLAEFDRNRAIQEQGIRDQQAALGVLGAGRAGVQLAEFGTGAARERALLQAGLLQQGFQQAFTGRDVSQLGTLGAINQAQEQARLDADREAARQAAFLPQQQLDRYAAQVTGLMGGYPGGTQQSFVPNPTPLQTALGIGTTLAGLYLGRS